jgi:hypothetical protein
MTTRDEAKRTAMAYAWARDDARKEFSAFVHAEYGTPTVTPAGATSGDWAFSEAYAQGQEDYNEQRRGDFIPVQDAWANWQASGGRSVFKRGELTLGADERAELRGLWPSFWDDDNDTSAYYARRDQMQNAAWDALPS